jgi:hypothetical protein
LRTDSAYYQQNQSSLRSAHRAEWSGQQDLRRESCPPPFGPASLCSAVRICSRQIREPANRFHIPPSRQCVWPPQSVRGQTH